MALDAVAALRGVVVDAPGPAIGPEPFAGVDVAGAAVLVRTGWSQHWRTERYGAGGHPHLTEAAVDDLVARRPALVGIDSVNIDATTTGERPAHTGLLGAGILVLEHLTALDQLDEPGFEVFAVPVKVRGLGTFPVRAFALYRSDTGRGS